MSTTAGLEASKCMSDWFTTPILHLSKMDIMLFGVLFCLLIIWFYRAKLKDLEDMEKNPRY